MRSSQRDYTLLVLEGESEKRLTLDSILDYLNQEDWQRNRHRHTWAWVLNFLCESRLGHATSLVLDEPDAILERPSERSEPLLHATNHHC